MDVNNLKNTEMTYEAEQGGYTGYKEYRWTIEQAREILKRVPKQWINFLVSGELPHKGNNSLPRKIMTKTVKGHDFAFPYGNETLVIGETGNFERVDQIVMWLQHFCDFVDDGFYDDQLVDHHEWKQTKIFEVKLRSCLAEWKQTQSLAA
jgi:hypothetical protein